MLIIVEGVDKTGKSTLVDFILKNMPDTYLLKNGSRPKDGSDIERSKIINAYWKILSIYRYSFKESILIMDRYVISELVYCLKRGYKALDDSEPGKELKMIINELEQEGDIIIIHCSTDPKLIKQKFIDDGEEYTNLDEVEKFDEKYRVEIGKLKIKNIPYDYTRTTPVQVVRRLELYKKEFDMNMEELRRR